VKRRSQITFQVLVALAVVATALLNPLETTIGIGGLVGFILIETSVHAGLAGRFLAATNAIAVRRPAIATFLGLTERQVRHRVADGELPRSRSEGRSVPSGPPWSRGSRSEKSRPTRSSGQERAAGGTARNVRGFSNWRLSEPATSGQSLRGVAQRSLPGAKRVHSRKTPVRHRRNGSALLDHQKFSSH
jgi:hypothetical protein